jgi:hypothetical protein
MMRQPAATDFRPGAGPVRYGAWLIQGNKADDSWISWFMAERKSLTKRLRVK